MAFPHDYMDGAGGAPSRCGVPIRRAGGPTLRGRAMQRDAASRSDVSARCGVPIRRFGQLPSRLSILGQAPSYMKKVLITNKLITNKLITNKVTDNCILHYLHTRAAGSERRIALHPCR